jgi:ribonucleoside-diphosphate reductase alpha subunit
MLSRVPEGTTSVDDVYEVFIEFLTSRSYLEKEYDAMACGLSMELHDSKTASSFVETTRRIQQNRDVCGNERPLLHKDFYRFIVDNADAVEAVYQKVVKETEPFPMTFFGWKTLFRSYLIGTHEGVMERPDHMWFRVALYLHLDDWEKTQQSFAMLRKGDAIHATPTLFHAGLLNAQLASCFLMGTEDSVTGIFKTVGDAAMISKFAGGIGIHISNIRGKNSYIYGTNGRSNGIMPMMRVYNDTSRYIDQCFETTTPVVTSRGILPIGEVRPMEDSVLTADGNFRRVNRKIVHLVDKDMVSLQVKTPWKEIVSCVMTRHHDMMWHRCNNNSDEFVPLDRAGFGDHPVYIQIEPRDIPLNESDCFAVGFLTSRLKPTEECMKYTLQYTGIRKHDTLVQHYIANSILDEAVISGVADCYSIVLDLHKITRATVPLPLDFNCLGEIPNEMLVAPLNKLRKFYEGYCAGGGGGGAKLRLIKYRLGSEDVMKAQIMNMTTLPAVSEVMATTTTPVGDAAGAANNQDASSTTSTTSTTLQMSRMLYDLEVEGPQKNYQTLVGLAHNGGGKRKGAFAMYIEPWHSDILDFVMARRNTGSEEERTRDLFLGLWVPDEFMRRVENNDDWYLMTENESPGLADVWGPDFDTLYCGYINSGKYVRKMKARDLWTEILRSQIETGTPYVLYKDACNRCSNQKNLGTIKSSNLCTEIIEYSDHKEYAVCNLASIALPCCLMERALPCIKPSFWIVGKKGCYYCTALRSLLDERGIEYEYIENQVILEALPQEKRARLVDKKTYPIVYQGDEFLKGGFMEVWDRYLKPDFDLEKLGEIVGTLVENLNIVIDKNAYPLEECRRSNLRHRPIGIGVQGLADVFMARLEAYDSDSARALNRRIFETLYFTALKKSNELALRDGAYESFQGSPLSKGILHFENFSCFDAEKHLSPENDWETLRASIMEKGTRNSLIVAPMPTASTSQILGNTESFEPLTSNFYVRRTLAGEFVVMNKNLRRFMEIGDAYTDTNRQSMILHKGSVQNTSLPKSLREVFRTVWEIPQKNLIEMAADRQMFIDQSQSFNVYLARPDMAVLTKIHFYGWKKELKTGCYYLRSRSAISSQNFNSEVSPPPTQAHEEQECTSCSS